MLEVDEEKKKLYEGLVKHYEHLPKCIIYRTVEMASTPSAAFDALYDFKYDMLPVTWDFHEQKWEKQKVVLD